MQVQETLIPFDFNGKETFLSTVEVIPSNLNLSSQTTCLFRPSYGATISNLRSTAILLAEALDRRVLTYRQPYESMLNPELEAIDLYKQTDDILWQKFQKGNDAMDVIAPSLGALLAAVSICYNPERTRNLILICPMGSTAKLRHTPEVFSRLDEIDDIRLRMEYAISQEYLENERKLLIKRGGKSIYQDLQRKVFKEPIEFYRSTKGLFYETKKNMRGGRNGVVVSRAFAIGSVTHISPELRKVRRNGKVYVIAGEIDPVFPPDEIAQTWRIKHEIDQLHIQEGIGHPSQTTSEGKELLKKAANILKEIT